MADVKSNLTHGSLVAAKAGSHYDKSFDAYMGSVMYASEGIINAVSRYDWSSLGSVDKIGSAYKYFFSDIASSLTAIHAVNYNINSYATRIQAEDIINVQRDNAIRGLQILKDSKATDFLQGEGP